MQLTELRLENFKCFKKPVTFAFPKLTILTGANSSGKSAVINAVLGALQSDKFPFEYATNGHYVNMGDFKDIVNGRDISKKVKIGISVSEVRRKYNTNLPIPLFLSKNSNEILHLDTLWQYQDENYLPVLYSLDNNLGQGNIRIKKSDSFYQFIVVDHDGTILFDGLDSIENRTNVESSRPAVHSIFKQLEGFIGVIQDDISSIGAFRLPPERTYLERPSPSKIAVDGKGYLDQIIYWQTRKAKEYDRLVEIMRELSLLENISSKRLNGGGRFEMLVQPKRDSPESSLADVGFGISQFLPIIVADLQLSDGSKLFVAEPEIHLHPNVQALFGDYMVKSINNSEKTYVIETHSEYLLNRLRLSIVKGELNPDDVKVYFLENNGDDTDVYDVAFGKDGQINNAPNSFFQTYLMDTMDIALNAFADE